MKRKKIWQDGKGLTLVELMSVIGIISILATIAIAEFKNYVMWTYETAAKEDLRKAYNASFLYFTDNPDGRITPAILESYGYKRTPRVNLRILKNTFSELLITSSFTVPGSQIFKVDISGAIVPVSMFGVLLASTAGMGAKPGSAQDPWANNPSIPEVQRFDASTTAGDQEVRTPADAVESLNANSLAKSELQMAYDAASSYLADNPEGIITIDILKAGGYTPSGDVNLVIANGTLPGLSMIAYSSLPGSQTYSVDFAGTITP